MKYSHLLFGRFIDVISSGVYNIGIAEARSKEYPNQYNIRHTHNLIGCPEMEIWTAIPEKFTNAAIYNVNGNMIVTTGGVDSATICVMSALDNGGSYCEVVHNVQAHAFSNVPESSLITITKHNYIPYMVNPGNIYIQNETMDSVRYVSGKNIIAGENVTSAKPQGEVIIENGANVIFNAENEVTLDGGFEVEVGAEFEVK